MLDDYAGRVREASNTRPGGIGIRNVVIRKGFTLQLCVIGKCACLWIGFPIKRGALVRIFTVAHLLNPMELQG